MTPATRRKVSIAVETAVGTAAVSLTVFSLFAIWIVLP